MHTDDPNADPLLNLVRKLEAAVLAEDRIGILIAMNRVQVRVLLRHGNIDPRRYEQESTREESTGDADS